MTDWLILAAIIGFIVVVAWCLWDDITEWHEQTHVRRCAGCMRHAVRVGCPVHDPQGRRADK